MHVGAKPYMEVNMLWDIVNLFMGSLPEEFEFLKAFGVLFVLYIFITLYKIFYDFTKSFLKGL